ncbi:MAG: DNA mismatch repair protein MutS [Rhodospirillaceae bacterium]|jgi:DNA mismatch repair protein MutS|nr:DNA mismatch repair protein MutS [Rhodospirillaceae bacterium]MBT5082246.1 DNA mismatch repair protein MutS [Rhodospirillaceae bacterium]MBT5526765.1 DNA mismatch repair protein MutS [Rhodospirillaceae bacterium]MBT5879130.1 DNA mismatch repair protein MutS [Rhodospirillaceae bacterium]MBT7286126.1 DNA mismatch repair protein MutS [Rhodospirillaceae bacterium]
MNDASATTKAAGLDKPTPMMEQFLSIKAGHEDCLLFYRMGDFYELFFDDAVKASEALDITLTKRGKHLGEDIPMCGVPVHAADTYLSRLIRKGFRVAVCEQTEDPAEAKKRGAKSVVRRAVVRLVTPGTLTEDAHLDARTNNYLAVLAQVRGAYALAWLDLSTGEFLTAAVTYAHIGTELARLSPGEIVVSDAMLADADDSEWQEDWAERITPYAAARFDSGSGARRLTALYKVASLDAYGDFSRAELAACGALVEYLEMTQVGRLPRLSPPRQVTTQDSMAIDPATRRNLELTRTLGGDVRGSVLATLDRTVSGAGARLLARHLSAPLMAPGAINRRLDMVDYFIAGERLRQDVRSTLRQTPDMARALSRLCLDRGGPRDLSAIRDGLGAAHDLGNLLSTAEMPLPPDGIMAAAEDLGRHDNLVDELTLALAPEPPISNRDGGFIAPGFRPDLDELRGLRDASRKLIMGLEGDYRRQSGIDNLKIKHNRVLGYFIEVAARRADSLLAAPLNESFIHRQTMANVVRFSTVDLGDLERRIAESADKALALELELFAQLTALVATAGDAITCAAEAIATLDVAAANAELAVSERLCRPVVDLSPTFDIQGGRHPVVEAALRERNEGAFIANDCALGEDSRIWLVTGPNMAGKSTFLRQNALIAILAQIGAYVPATSAHIGAVDRLFSRVGAADDLARGRSTFMVEMVEAAAILNQATERSLVILDEIGRGTATYDGLSIAWAAVEHLHEVNNCRALFATHYHELTALSGKLDSLANVTMRVKEWQGDVVFLHEVGPGAADRSYGIQVAKLAGLPDAVIARAEVVLAGLEESEANSGPGGSGGAARLADDLPLFAAIRPTAGGGRGAGAPSAVETALADILPDSLSPREALDLIYQLKAAAEED